LASHGQIGQERLDLGRAERSRVPLAVEKDEAFNPLDIRLLGPDAVMLEPDLVAHASEQPRGIGGFHEDVGASSYRPHYWERPG
jgi:hypothetical protein